MQVASEALEFEQAARLRDTLTEVEAVSQRRKLSSVRGEDVDVYGVRVEGGNAALTILVMRGGQVLDRRELFWEGRIGVTAEQVLSELLPQIYDRTTFIPAEIHLPLPIDGDEALVDWLSERKGKRVYLRLPARGAKAQRVALAMRNADMAYSRRFREAPPRDQAVQALVGHLSLSEAPQRIEGFDVSNLQGEEMVASMVVWEEGRMRKAEYRSFNVRDLGGADDFAAIRQVVQRRYRRRLAELGTMPDLILVDGGRGQLNAALAALAELGVEETAIVGLAKREEEIYLPARPEPLRLPRADAGLRLLQEVRDEAHRFALARHRRRRRVRVLRSRLDDLIGVGPRRRKLLVARFGSAAGVEEASCEELQEALGPAIGRRVHEQLHGVPPSTPPPESPAA
jgi:excinuclease ABC subunit C